MTKHFDNTIKFAPREGMAYALSPRDGSKLAATVAMGMRPCGMSAHELMTSINRIHGVDYSLSYVYGSQIAGGDYMAKSGFGVVRNTETVGEHIKALREHGGYDAGKDGPNQIAATADEAADMFWQSLPEGMRRDDAPVVVHYVWAAGGRVVAYKAGREACARDDAPAAARTGEIAPKQAKATAASKKPNTRQSGKPQSKRRTRAKTQG